MKIQFLKKIFTILFIFSAFLAQKAYCQTLSAGTIIRVYPSETISTALNQKEDSVFFANPSDLWLDEVCVIPKNAIFEGHIDFLKMPLNGVNGALSIKITKVLFPNGVKKDLNGTIQLNGKKIIGGERTAARTYNYAVHSQPAYGWWGGMKGSLQYVPTNNRESGKHTTLNPKDALLIILDEDTSF